jgi:hypothetical protein
MLTAATTIRPAAAPQQAAAAERFRTIAEHRYVRPVVRPAPARRPVAVAFAGSAW